MVWKILIYSPCWFQNDWLEMKRWNGRLKVLRAFWLAVTSCIINRWINQRNGNFSQEYDMENCYQSTVQFWKQLTQVLRPESAIKTGGIKASHQSAMIDFPNKWRAGRGGRETALDKKQNTITCSRLDGHAVALSIVIGWNCDQRVNKKLNKAQQSPTEPNRANRQVFRWLWCDK